MAKFASRAIRCKILSEGPYFYHAHYIHLERWRPDFDVETTQIVTAMAWVRFPTIALEYFDEGAFLEVAKVFGRPIKVDSMIAAVSRGQFARVCVELDLAKPLVTRFWLRRKLHHVVYEGLLVICFSCGRVGHRDNVCPHVIRPSTSGEHQAASVSQSEAAASPSNSEPPVEIYREWMQVRSRRCQGGNKSQVNSKKLGSQSVGYSDNYGKNLEKTGSK